MSKFLSRVRLENVLLLILFVFVSGCNQSSTDVSKKAAVKPAPREAIDGPGSDKFEGWNLVWADEFEGDKIDSAKWKHETGNWGWGNKELQNYTAGDNTQVTDGLLKITAKKTGEGQKVGNYTSSRLNSIEFFTYGRMEIRAKMPEYKGKGVWPAIWMLGKNISSAGWPACGELDILEYVSYSKGKMHSAIHCKARNHKDKTQVETGPLDLETIESEFHIYGLEWSEDKIVFYTDQPDNVKLTYDRPKDFDAENWPFDKPHYFLLNVAVGGSWGGQQGVEDKTWPSTMEVDFVRVYQQIPKK